MAFSLDDLQNNFSDIVHLVEVGNRVEVNFILFAWKDTDQMYHINSQLILVLILAKFDLKLLREFGLHLTHSHYRKY